MPSELASRCLVCTGPVRVCGLVGSWMLAQLVTEVGADEAEAFVNYHR